LGLEERRYVLAKNIIVFNNKERWEICLADGVSAPRVLIETIIEKILEQKHISSVTNVEGQGGDDTRKIGSRFPPRLILKLIDINFNISELKRNVK